MVTLLRSICSRSVLCFPSLSLLPHNTAAGLSLRLPGDLYPQSRFSEKATQRKKPTERKGDGWSGRRPWGSLRECGTSRMEKNCIRFCFNWNDFRQVLHTCSLMPWCNPFKCFVRVWLLENFFWQNSQAFEQTSWILHSLQMSSKKWNHSTQWVLVWKEMLFHHHG